MVRYSTCSPTSFSALHAILDPELLSYCEQIVDAHIVISIN